MYSGGGVEPDKRLAGPVGPGASGGFNPTRFGRLLNARQEFANYAQRYMAEGDTRIAQRSTGLKTVRPNFVVDDAIVADFRQRLVRLHRRPQVGRARGPRVVEPLRRFA